MRMAQPKLQHCGMATIKTKGLPNPNPTVSYTPSNPGNHMCHAPAPRQPSASARHIRTHTTAGVASPAVKSVNQRPRGPPEKCATTLTQMGNRTETPTPGKHCTTASHKAKHTPHTRLKGKVTDGPQRRPAKTMPRHRLTVRHTGNLHNATYMCSYSLSSPEGTQDLRRLHRGTHLRSYFRAASFRTLARGGRPVKFSTTTLYLSECTRALP